MSKVYRFGRYRLDVARLELQRDGGAVPLTPRVLSTLLLLVENAGRTVSKQEMLGRLWPGRFAEEANLSQAVSGVRKALAADGDSVDLILTVPGQGYRFIGEVTVEGEEAVAPPPPPAPRARRRWGVTAAGGAIAVVGVAVAGWLALRPTPRPSPAGGVGVVLADARNATGDPAFDPLVRRLTEADLSQSPLLQVASESRVADTLELMRQPKGAPMTLATARAVCQRLNAGVVIQPTISTLGRSYVLLLAATGCVDGRSLGEERGEAASKEQVAAALDALSARLRRRLGESQASIARLDVPLVPERTGSFDALLAYSEGMDLQKRGQFTEAAAAFQRAVDLDPAFAAAWLALGQQYASLKQAEAAARATTRAYELRGETSQRMRLLIASRYDVDVTKDYDAAINEAALTTQLYPNDVAAWINLSGLQNWVGRYDEAGVSARRALALDPNSVGGYTALSRALSHTGRIAEAVKVDRMAVAAGRAAGETRALLSAHLYMLGQVAEAEKLIATSAGTPLERYGVLEARDIAIARGRVREADALWERGETLSAAHGLHLPQPFQAYSHAILGRSAEARRAMALTPPAQRTGLYTMAEAIVGPPAQAEADLARELARWPHDTLLNGQYAPLSRAHLLMRRGDGSGAVRVLQGAPLLHRTVDTPYLLGQALLMTGDARSAAEQFRWVLAHTGIGLDPQCDLGHLGLARALRAAGDLPGARAEYARFLDVWRDADADLPDVVAAKAEAARLTLAERGRTTAFTSFQGRSEPF